MRVTEIFKSIQGEGKYSGYPSLFIRLSGCTRKCSWCDSPYHIEGKEISTEKIINKIKSEYPIHIVWTGGEPLLQINDIKKVISKTGDFIHCLESNGDLIENLDKYLFDYHCFSPKDKNSLNKVLDWLPKKLYGFDYDIKIVTDLRTNKDLLKNSTFVMPLTTCDEKKTRMIEQKVWNYCVKNNKKFCLRQHVHVWGNERKK